METVVALLVAALGGLIGTFCGACFLSIRENLKMKKVRNIAIKALNVIKKYSKQSYKKAENDFNTSLSLVEKRTVLVALHKLGIPIGVPTNESFDLKEVHFVDMQIDENVIKEIILQVKDGYCDHLFYLDPDQHFAANYAMFALRNAAKRYVNDVLAKSTLKQNLITLPAGWEFDFSPGELKPIIVFSEQVNIPLNFDTNGNPRQEKIQALLKDVDLGLWDSYLLWNYEAYINAKNQIRMGEVISSLPFSAEGQDKHE